MILDYHTARRATEHGWRRRGAILRQWAAAIRWLWVASMLLALSSFAWPFLKPASYYRDLPPTPVMLCFVQFPFFFLITYAARAIMLELADACYERAEKGERPARP